MTTRRTLLAMTAGLVAPALAAHAQTPATPATPAAPPLDPAPVAKEQVGYQDVPWQGKVCAQCVYFIFYPAKSAAPASRCKLVAGPISPAGWCEIWAPGH